MGLLMSYFSSSPADRVPLNILLVDDEPPARQRLRDLLGDLAQSHPNKIVGECANGIEALQWLERHSAHLVFCDVRMPGLDGLGFAAALQQRYPPGHSLPAPALILVTAFDDCAVEAFERDAVDYLLKPVRASRLAAAMDRACRRHPDLGREILPLDGAAPKSALAPVFSSGATPRLRYLPYNDRGHIGSLPIDEICYLQADLKYVTARTLEREYLLEGSLVQMEAALGSDWIRLHRSVLARRSAISGFVRHPEHWLATFRGLPDQVPVSRRQWPAVKEAFLFMIQGGEDGPA